PTWAAKHPSTRLLGSSTPNTVSSLNSTCVAARASSTCAERVEHARGARHGPEQGPRVHAALLGQRQIAGATRGRRLQENRRRNADVQALHEADHGDAYAALRRADEHRVDAA